MLHPLYDKHDHIINQAGYKLFMMTMGGEG